MAASRPVPLELEFEDDGDSFRLRRQRQLDRASRRLTSAQRMITASFWFVVPFAAIFAATVLFTFGTVLVEAHPAVMAGRSAVKIGAVMCPTAKDYRDWMEAARSSKPAPTTCFMADTDGGDDPVVVALLGHDGDLYDLTIRSGGSAVWSNPGSSTGRWVTEPWHDVSGWLSCGQVRPDKTLANNAC